MKIEYEIIEPIGLVIIRAKGKITIEDRYATFDAIIKDPRNKPGLKYLEDLAEASYDYGIGDLKKYFKRMKSFSTKFQGSKIAVFAPDLATYTLAREYELMIKAVHAYDYNVFKDFDEALEWLLAKDN